MSALNNIAKADSLLQASRRVIRNNVGISPEAAELIAEAHAVATLALAQQQHIANLIALAQTGEAQSSEGQAALREANELLGLQEVRW